MGQAESLGEPRAGEPGRAAPPRGDAAPAGSAPDWRADGSQVFDPRRKSPALACVLSLMPGLGQIYVGYYVRGFVHIAVVGTVIAILAEGNAGPMEPLFGIFLPFFWLYNVVDAGRRAALVNHAMRGGQMATLPADMALPSGGGSLVGGIVMIAVGSLLLARTRFDVSLAWLRDWWPAIPILMGVYLVVQAVRARSLASGRDR